MAINKFFLYLPDLQQSQFFPNRKFQLLLERIYRFDGPHHLLCQKYDMLTVLSLQSTELFAATTTSNGSVAPEN